MKKLIFGLILFCSVFWALASLFFFAFNDQQRSFVEEALYRFSLPTVVFLILIWFLRWTFSSLRYLEKNSTEKPIFKRKQVRSTEIDVPTDFDFSFLKTKIAEKWLITFSDDTAGVLKFREKWSFTEGIGGIGAWINYDSTTQKLYVEGFAQLEKRYLKEEAQELQKEIANCVGIDIFEEED